MRKIVSILLAVIMTLTPLGSLGAVGHAPGCPNTGFNTDCCTKQFEIEVEDGYEIVDVLVNGVSQGPITTYSFGDITADQTIEVLTRKIGEDDTWAGWNEPVLGTGLTPVNWNGSSWVTTTVENWDYNYDMATAGHETVAGDGTAKWANAQTADGSQYVWIPRYTYKITSGYHQSGNSWSSVDNPGTNKIEVKFSQGTIDDTSDSYIKHPAFTFGTDELKGIWVAKYEASRNDATESSAGSGTTVSFKPGVISWRSLSVSNMYDYSYNLNRDLDSHLMKNSEWGAVAYLTNAIGKIPYINNSSSFITGNAGGSQDASSASGTTNAWNTAGGVKASTTHNVYGIYDLSGGSWEYVSAYYEGGDSTYLANDTTNKTYAGSLYTNKDTKYVEVYPTTEDDAAYSADITGDAVYETSDDAYGTSWDGDYSNAPLSAGSVFLRGGNSDFPSLVGVFCFDNSVGDAYSDNGFRAVLSPETGGSTPTVTPTVNADTSGANAPVLATGLTPVNWNGTEWVETTEANWKYNYNLLGTATHSSVEGNGDGAWANAQTADGSQYVWIPRYTYKITSGYHSSGNSWSSLDSPGTNKIEIKFSNGTTDDVTDGATNASEGYIKHPAFTFGTDELEGIWVAKYEASRNDATSSSDGSGTTVSSKPGVRSWTNISVSQMYDYAYNLNRTLDSHLMKNSEWGAVAYLTNAIGKIPYINNYYSASFLKTTTGNAGGSQNASGSVTLQNAWNTAGGVKASTTHNVYGIYDLSGGAAEYVSAYYTGGDSTYLSGDKLNKEYAGSLFALEISELNGSSKYVDAYDTSYISSNTGDAMYETSSSSSGTTSWDGDCSVAPASDSPIFLRGGAFINASDAGLFYFGTGNGEGAKNSGFRTVLAPQSGGSTPSTYTVTYNANGGSGSMSPQTFTEGVAQNLTLNTFTKVGYDFAGWTTDASEDWIEYGDGESYTATGNVTLYALWELAEYTIYFDANGGTGIMGRQTFRYGETENLPPNEFTREGYTFIGWATSADGTVVYEDEASFSASENATLYAVWEEAWAGWNAPVLGTGLTPVNWSGSAWVTTDVANWDYNYTVATTHTTVAGNATAKWANAQTSDGSLYVWIPRYTYKITSGYHESGNSWSSVDSPGTNKIEIKFSKGTTDDVTSGATNASQGYIKHPAFTFGTDELEGIWVAKYEASRSNATSSSRGTDSAEYNIPTSKPGVQSWVRLSVSNMYDYAYNLNRTLDSHLMRNSEWGAVAYLTNAIGKIPYINNSSNVNGNTNKVTGAAGGSQDAASVSGVENAWNTAGGVKASTTHNVYGIYDLSGGLYEYVSAYYEGGNSTHLSEDTTSKTRAGSLYANKDTKYVEVYTTNANGVAYIDTIVGDAVYETSSQCDSEGPPGGASWDGDHSIAPNSTSPVFVRGGQMNDTSYAGLFNFNKDSGADSYSGYAFRVVFAIPSTSTPSIYTVAFDANGGTGTMSSQSFNEGVAQNLTTNTFTREGYDFIGWSTTAGGAVEYTDGASYTVTGNTTLYAVWEEAWAGWNAPVLGTGLTPVNWNGSSWVTTDVANWDYNYTAATTHTTVAGNGTAKWANAQTSDGSLYVWIPRYTYKITSGYHTSGNSWSSVDSAGSNKIEVKFSNGTTDDVTSGATNASEGYIKHPAFTFGTDELKGIWVAKYEASRKNATSSSVGTDNSTNNVPTFKPGVQSWRSLSVSKMYDYAYNLNRTLDSHLMKNSEWGAVAYLTNAIGKIPYINNSSTYITGNAGGTQDAEMASGTANAWNTVKGVKASSTHNVYGIYDLSGGSWENVSAYYTEGDSSYLSGDTSSKEYAGSLYTNRNTKYVETYSTVYDSTKTGDALYETSSSDSGTNSSWDGDYSGAPASVLPVFSRGGNCLSPSAAGVFCFGPSDGVTSSYCGFRAVLAPQEGGSTPATYTVTFDANGGSGSMSPQTFTEGVAQNLTSNTFTRSGYNFLGWSTNSGATTATYTNGQSYTATGDVTLYAVWKKSSYTVTITGSAYYSKVEIKNTYYSSAATLSVTPGTTVTCSCGYGSVKVNGTTVSSSSYTYTVNSDITINFDSSDNINITEK